ncbi:hypothetical protein D3C76_1456120 [compost metagenome]
MQLVRRSEPLDSGDFRAFVHYRQGQAGIDAPAVDNDRAGAALAVVATFLGAGELQVFAQQVEQGGAGVKLHFLPSTVHPDRQFGLDRVRRVGGRCLCRNERRQDHGRCGYHAHDQEFSSGNRHDVEHRCVSYG